MKISLRQKPEKLEVVSLNSPLQGMNDCGMNALQNIELLYATGGAVSDLEEELGERCSHTHVAYLRRILEQLMIRLACGGDTRQRIRTIRNTQPFLLNRTNLFDQKLVC